MYICSKGREGGKQWNWELNQQQTLKQQRAADGPPGAHYTSDCTSPCLSLSECLMFLNLLKALTKMSK